jgi:basic membrane protein A
MLAACATPTQAPAVSNPEPTTAAKLKFAAVFPGVITDADYNTLAYIGVQAVKADLGVDTAYSESVAVPDVDRVMREYIDQGYNVIWTHGGQFINATVTLAKAFPNVVFIGEGDAPVDNPPANLWIIDRNFHVGFYAVGHLAGLLTKTGKIGYIGGQTLPFSYAEVHAMQQALKDMNSTAELKTVWTGDFNDPTKARSVSDAMIADNVDVIVGSLNLGMFGVFESVKAAQTPILVTAKYTDKTSFAPKNYVTSSVKSSPVKRAATTRWVSQPASPCRLPFSTCLIASIQK